VQEIAPLAIITKFPDVASQGTSVVQRPAKSIRATFGITLPYKTCWPRISRAPINTIIN
jgi:hypothetical protein